MEEGRGKCFEKEETRPRVEYREERRVVLRVIRVER